MFHTFLPFSLQRSRSLRSSIQLTSAAFLVAAALLVPPPAAAWVFGNGTSFTSRNSSISDDGRYVVFMSTASNLVAEDTTGICDVFRLDNQTGTVLLVNAVTQGIL